MEETYKGYTIKIEQDEYPESPREWDNLGTMICFHNRYDLGDKHDLNSKDFNSWNELEAYLRKENNIAIILPLYLYDHSGITMNTTGFSCPWDSGQVGFIYITKEKLRYEYSCKKITKKWIEKVTGYLNNEVKTYDQYLMGDVYGYTVEDEDGEQIDSCVGFYGTEEAENEAKSIVDGEVKKHGEQIEMFA
jgi:hypothetical protein